jgi:hypothetical protein
VKQLFFLAVGFVIAAHTAVAQTPRMVRAPNMRPSTVIPAIDTLWVVGLDEMAGPDSLFGIMASAVPSADGRRIFVTDPHADAVRVFDAANGTLLERVGRKGGGPGEFRFADRVAVLPNGTTFVNDLGRGAVIELNSALQYVRDIHPSRPIDGGDFLATGTSFVFTGIMRRGPCADCAIHVVAREDGKYLRSFGTLPEASSEVISQTIGSGVVAWARDGNIWYAQRAPYLIQKFTPEGELLLVLTRENDFLPDAADKYKVEYQGRRMRIESRPHAVAVQIFEAEGGMLVLEVWLYGNHRLVDVYDKDFQLRASYVGELPVFVASLGNGRYLVNGRGPDDQFWVGVVRMDLP